MIVIKVVQSILLMMTEILIKTLSKILTIEAKVQMAIVMIITQEDGMVMPMVLHCQKMSVKNVK